MDIQHRPIVFSLILQSHWSKTKEEKINDTTTTFKYLLRGAWRGEPEPGGVGGDTDHGAAGHEVADGVGPPGVVVPLVHQVLPCHQLQHSSFVDHLDTFLRVGKK
jgi:hypothetical protein